MDRVAGTDLICIKDAEIGSITEITSDCTATDEYLITCEVITTPDGYPCTVEGSRYKVEGMVHSGINEQTENNPPEIIFHSPESLTQS